MRTIILAGLLALLAGPPSGQATAGLSGTVVTDETTPRPVRQAIVTVSGAGLSLNRSTITDDQGRFAFASLPAGRFTISAAKAAFITSAYGARRPGRSGTPVTLAAEQRVDDIRVSLPRAGVITGTVRDNNGAPAPGVVVTAVTAVALATYSAFMTPGASTAVTDDQGSYRIFGLFPGEYVVFTSMRFDIASELSVFSAAEIDAAFQQLKQGSGRATGAPSRPAARPVIMAPTFYPGAVRFAQAGRVSIGAGDERSGVDISIAMVPTASVEGVVLGVDGLPLRGATVDLELDGPDIDGAIRLFGGGPSAADGRFAVHTVVPGDYFITARAPNLVSRSRVSVEGTDVAGLTLRMHPAPKVTGRVVFDATSLTPPAELKGYTIALRPDRGQSDASQYVSRSKPATVAADGSFTVAGLVPGRYLVDSGSKSAGMTGWTLRSAIVGGLDALDRGLEIGDTDVSMIVTMSDRHSELSGTLQTPGGAPAAEFIVVVIPTDRALWRPGSRRIKFTRPATNGRYLIRDLPGGEYVLGALTDVDAEDLKDAAFLEKLVPAGVTFTLADGERKVQDLRIVR